MLADVTVCFFSHLGRLSSALTLTSIIPDSNSKKPQPAPQKEYTQPKKPNNTNAYHNPNGYRPDAKAKAEKVVKADAEKAVKADAEKVVKVDAEKAVKADVTTPAT